MTQAQDSRQCKRLAKFFIKAGRTQKHNLAGKRQRQKEMIILSPQTCQFILCRSPEKTPYEFVIFFSQVNWLRRTIQAELDLVDHLPSPSMDREEVQQLTDHKSSLLQQLGRLCKTRTQSQYDPSIENSSSMMLGRSRTWRSS